ncbi:hypothetical protein ACIBCT_38505 [Streptosporangium sp. NPDC050855]|uniref:hypothetical protein n=1 Tax=Streptosporangium sp. NPDC050855 TaxID=3366194 RepID=UPI0037B18E0C
MVFDPNDRSLRRKGLADDRCSIGGRENTVGDVAAMIARDRPTNVVVVGDQADVIRTIAPGTA